MVIAFAEAALCAYIFSLPRLGDIPTWIGPVAGVLATGLIVSGAILHRLMRSRRRPTG